MKKILSIIIATILIITLIAVPVIVAFALIIAMLLNQKIACRGLFRMIFFLPIIIEDEIRFFNKK